MAQAGEIATTFEQERPRLRAIATGILGSIHDADDAVQETWLRLEKASQSEIANLGAWLTVVVSRVALDQVRSRNRRREVAIDDHLGSTFLDEGAVESAVVLEESVSEALSQTLDRLSPLESATFILHDLFHLPFDELSEILNRSPESTRKMASRARQKLSSQDVSLQTTGGEQRAIIEAFLHAAGTGDLNRLIAVLAPNVTLNADLSTQRYGSQPELRGAAEVAGQFLGRAQAARVVWLNGQIGAGWIERGKVKVAFEFEIKNGLIEQIWLRSNPDYLSTTDFELELTGKRA